jgi:hypothetical protein
MHHGPFNFCSSSNSYYSVVKHELNIINLHRHDIL